MNLLHKLLFSGGNDSKITICETTQKTTGIKFQSHYLLIGAMLAGKKTISVANSEPFDFLPNEVLVVAPKQTLRINNSDSNKMATRWVNIEIPSAKVVKILEVLNEETLGSKDLGNWSLDENNFSRLKEDQAINQLVRRLVRIFMDDEPYKDHLIDINISELIIRLLHSKCYHHLTSLCRQNSLSSGIASAVQHIKRNLERKILIPELASIAGMSKANFYRYFKNELGITPIQFIKKERIDQACKLLRDHRNSITDVCYSVGFSSLSHFICTFKEQQGLTPKLYQSRA